MAIWSNFDGLNQWELRNAGSIAAAGLHRQIGSGVRFVPQSLGDWVTH